MAGTLFAPNFIPSLPDESIQPGIYTCLVVCTVGSIASTVFRFLVKWKYQVKIRKDDCAILFSTVVNFVANIFQFIAIYHGFGRHTQFLGVADCIMANKYAMLIVPLGVIANLGSKMSIAFLILSLIEGTHRRLYRLTIATMSITAFLGCLCVILWATQTVPQPLSKIWDPTLPGPLPNAWKFLGILYAIGGFNVATDLLYSLSPLYFLRNVRSIGARNKIFIQILVGSGLLVTIVAIVSLSYAGRFLVIVDMTWILVPRYVCDMLERNLAVIIANAPMIKTMATKRRASQYTNTPYRNSKPLYGYRSGASKPSSGSEGTATTGVLDAEAGPGTWFAKESVGEPATMEVEVTAEPPMYSRSHNTTRGNSLELPLEGHTTGGLKIMKSVDITVEGASGWSSEEDEAKTALPEIPLPPEPVAMQPERRGSETSIAGRRGLSRAQSTTSLASTRTGHSRYSLFPPPSPAQPSPPLDSVLPKGA